MANRNRNPTAKVPTSRCWRYQEWTAVMRDVFCLGRLRVWGHCKLPHWVQAKPGHQIHLKLQLQNICIYDQNGRIKKKILENVEGLVCMQIIWFLTHLPFSLPQQQTSSSRIVDEDQKMPFQQTVNLLMPTQMQH